MPHPAAIIQVGAVGECVPARPAALQVRTRSRACGVVGMRSRASGVAC